MPGDTLFTRRARLGELIGIRRKQAIDPDMQTQFNGYIEDAIREITRAHEWEFMRTPDTIELQAKHAGGTVSTTDGSVTVTGVDTGFPTGWPNQTYAEFRVQGESYPVVSIDSGTQITLAQAAVYMACAPKSNASYKAVAAAMDDVKNNRTVPVPKSLRNAPHPGMAEQFGHSKGYQYSHDHPGGVSPDQEYLGVDKQFYFPTDRGYEKHITAYLDYVRKLKARAKQQPEGK